MEDVFEKKLIFLVNRRKMDIKDALSEWENVGFWESVKSLDGLIDYHLKECGELTGVLEHALDRGGCLTKLSSMGYEAFEGHVYRYRLKESK